VGEWFAQADFINFSVRDEPFEDFHTLLEAEHSRYREIAWFPPNKALQPTAPLRHAFDVDLS